MVGALFLAALGPATDADSLDYHLGVPLDWIRHGGAFARSDWLHARLVGLGESINLLGLGAGTDSLGAVVQFAGLILAWRVIVGLCKDDRSRVLISLLVLTLPLLLFLVPSQKPQMFPAAAIVVALILLAGNPALDRRELLVGMLLLASAIASKYSMLLTGGVVILYGLHRARRHRLVGFASLALIVSMALFAGPIYLRNLAFYGDPLSPFLERFLPDGEMKIIAFAMYLRSFAGGAGLERLLAIPKEWLFSPNLLVGSNVFGIGLLALLTLGKCARSCAVFVGGALGMLCLQLLLGQVTPRFFLEGYLLMCAAVAATPWNSRKLLLQRALTVQSCLTAVMAVYTAALLFPGSLSEAQRERVMSVAAFHYQASKWLDEVLPEDVLLLAEMRSNALLPRPFRSNTEFAYVRRDQYLDGLAELSRGEDRVVFARYFYPEYPFPELESCSSRLVSTPREFEYASRNPFFRREMSAYSIVVEELDPDKPGCPWANGEPR